MSSFVATTSDVKIVLYFHLALAREILTKWNIILHLVLYTYVYTHMFEKEYIIDDSNEKSFGVQIVKEKENNNEFTSAKRKIKEKN